MASSAARSARPASRRATSASYLLARGHDIGVLADDRALHLGELFEVAHQRIDALDARALEIAVVGEHARDRPDIVLLQQQLDLLVTTERIGRAQQRGEGLALRFERAREAGAAFLQCGQFVLLAGQAFIECTYRFRRVIDGELLFAQCARGLGMFAAGRALLLGSARICSRTASSFCFVSCSCAARAAGSSGCATAAPSAVSSTPARKPILKS
ncbi:MAG: hypothetical protein KIS84_06555 [Dokdonella sp.]|nr:hypothetical protein [Dokdonella sp.]